MANQEAKVGRGATVEVAGRRVGEVARKGEILEVLGSPDHPHYTVRWSDGHESVFYPGSDATIRPKPKSS
jgi:hypothetical protein